METKYVSKNYTQALREMKSGEIIELPAKALASLKSTILTRLRNELITENADWIYSEINKKTGTFKIKRIVKSA